MKLAEKLLEASRRTRVVEAAVRLIDEEVKSKGGLSGIAVKGAYGVVKAVKLRFVPEVVDAMLDEWVERLEPFWNGWSADAGGKSFPQYVSGRKGDVAEALLGVTDGRAKNSRNGTVRRMYDKMRPTAKKHVEEAVPRLGQMVEREMA